MKSLVPWTECNEKVDIFFHFSWTVNENLLDRTRWQQNPLRVRIGTWDKFLSDFASGHFGWFSWILDAPTKKIDHKDNRHYWYCQWIVSRVWFHLYGHRIRLGDDRYYIDDFVKSSQNLDIEWAQSENSQFLFFKRSVFWDCLFSAYPWPVGGMKYKQQWIRVSCEWRARWVLCSSLRYFSYWSLIYLSGSSQLIDKKRNCQEIERTRAEMLRLTNRYCRSNRRIPVCRWRTAVAWSRFPRWLEWNESSVRVHEKKHERYLRE